MSAEKRNELRDIAQSQLPEPIYTMAYMEHQLDLMGQVLLDLAQSAQFEEGSPEASRVAALEAVMSKSSIDFDSIEHPLQAYKIPKTVEFKDRTRRVQNRYLQAQIENGIISI